MGEVKNGGESLVKGVDWPVKIGGSYVKGVE